MSKWGEMTAEYEWGFEKGEKKERQRITDIILKLTDHKEHSEACLKMHWLAEHAIATMWEEEE